MNKFFLITVLALIFTTNIFTQTFFQNVEGKWQGTLEYSDYTSNKRVTMNTQITIKSSPDGNSADIFTIYDDFGEDLQIKRQRTN